jgi:formate hydrogenlyase subunit 6/NADH:ubiquinone oxidoreductase subunit I
MKIATMLHDNLRSLFRKPVTVLYPAARQPAPDRLRAKLHWNPEKCTGCCLCVKDCPSNALELITIDRENKRFVMRYDVGRCTFCSQCVQNCRFNCLEMSNEEWELAATSKTPFTVYYGRETDIESLVDQVPDTRADRDK